jgi:hypothetical protein
MRELFMRGLDPRIRLKTHRLRETMDCRVKPGNGDGWASVRSAEKSIGIRLVMPIT